MTTTAGTPAGRPGWPPGFQHKARLAPAGIEFGPPVGLGARLATPVGGRSATKVATPPAPPRSWGNTTFPERSGNVRPPPRPPGPDLDDPIALLRQGAEVAVLLDKGRYVPAELRRAADRAAEAAARVLGLPHPLTVRWFAGRYDPEPGWDAQHALGRVDRLAAPRNAKAFLDLDGPAAIYVRLAAADSPWAAATSAAHELRHLWQRDVLGAGKMARASAEQRAVLEVDATGFAADVVAQLEEDGAFGEDAA